MELKIIIINYYHHI